MMFDEIKLKSDGIALLRDGIVIGLSFADIALLRLRNDIVLGSKLTGRRV